MGRSCSFPLSGRQAWRALVLAIVLALLWGVLAGNAGWGFGAVAVVLGTLAGVQVALPKPPRWSPLRLGRFLIYFLKESLQGGVDIALRALHPRLPLQPVWIDYRLRLPGETARILFVMTISLLPGTLSADWEGDTVTVHALTPEAGAGLEDLEERIAALFALTLGEEGGHG